jgi:uncharacterized protein (TIGR02722 family)
MKRTVLTAALCATVFVLFAACSSVPKVTRIDAETQVDLSGRWNDTDIRIVCDTLIRDALASNRVDQYIRDFSGKSGGVLPTVIVGRFRNTSSEHIDTGIISGIMRTSILNSGKLDFVEGGEARDAIRAERQDQQSNASVESAAALAQETGANLMLTGEVNATVDRAGNTTVRSYFVTATLTNVETNRILWEGSNNEIKKVIKQPGIKP